MNDSLIKSILAGLFLGIWPLLMNKSGLKGDLSAMALSATTTIGLLPIVLYRNGFSIPEAKWMMVAFAGIFSLMGLLNLNGMLAITPPEKISASLTIVFIMQIVVAASYKAYLDGHMPLDKFLGYAAASLAAYLLLR